MTHALCAHVSCSVSDRHKLLLLKAPGIFTYLTLGLFLDPEQPGGQNGLHPVPVEVQSVWQRNVTETLLQLALFPSGRDALLAEPSVLEALRAVVESGMSAEAREHAEGALLALSDKEIHASPRGGPKHIMLSYQVRQASGLAGPFSILSHPGLFAQWDSQPMILRIHSSLCSRGYLVWIDTEMMKGSTMDAMSEAIEGAAVICYGASLA